MKSYLFALDLYFGNIIDAFARLLFFFCIRLLLALDFVEGLTIVWSISIS
jgi:hypothetical protein